MAFRVASRRLSAVCPSELIGDPKRTNTVAGAKSLWCIGQARSLPERAQGIEALCGPL